MGLPQKRSLQAVTSSTGPIWKKNIHQEVAKIPQQMLVDVVVNFRRRLETGTFLVSTIGINLVFLYSHRQEKISKFPRNPFKIVTLAKKSDGNFFVIHGLWWSTPLAHYKLFAKQIFRRKNAFRQNQLTNNEQPSTHYLFVYSPFVSDKKCFVASWRIFLLSFVKKLPHWWNSNETLTAKNKFAQTTNNRVHTIRVLPTFCHFVVIREWCIAGYRLYSITM